MPRSIDPRLEKRVLDAARKLWHSGGGEALTIRSVAKAAGTNPPALYRRFPNREAILKALVENYQLEFLREVESSKSLAEFGLRVLEVAVQQPREYELFLWGLRQGVTKARPVAQLFIQRCAEELGGPAADHLNLAAALGALVRGTVMQILDKQIEVDPAQARAAFVCAVNILIENERILRSAKWKGDCETP